MASQETAAKKDREKKKQKNKQDKAEKKAERQANSSKGKSLEDMMVYLDENGNFTNTPPDPKRVRKEINIEDIVLGAAPIDNTPQEKERKGIVTFFNEAKGYGFINDLKSQQSVFVHINQLSGPLKERDKVTFETEQGPKGLTAVNVKKTN